MKVVDRKTIGDSTYEVTQFGAKKGRSVLLRAFKMLGPAAGAIAEDQSKLANAVDVLARSATEEDLDYLCDECAKCTKLIQVGTFNGTEKEISQPLSESFDSHFRGRYLEMIQWLVFSLQHNFASFLGEMQNVSKGPLAAFVTTKTPLQSPKE